MTEPEAWLSNCEPIAQTPKVLDVTEELAPPEHANTIHSAHVGVRQEKANFYFATAAWYACHSPPVNNL